LPKLIGLSPSKRTPLYNGALECRLYEFKMVSGAMRREKSGARP
jgi:putative N6-adenine-specific DNA methylase